MITQPQYVWHHIELHMTSLPLFMLSHHAMTSHPLYSCHHTQDTCLHIHCSWTVTYSVLIIPHLLYVWHQSLYMWVLYEFYIFYRNSTWHHTHSLWHNSIHDVTSTLFMIAHPLYMTSHTLYLRHPSHCICDKTPPMVMTSCSVYMTSHMVY